MEQLEIANNQASRPEAYKIRTSVTPFTTPAASRGASASLATDSEAMSPAPEEPRPAVQAWLARAHESIQAFGGLIGGADSAAEFEDEYPESTSSLDDDDGYDDAVDTNVEEDKGEYHDKDKNEDRMDIDTEGYNKKEQHSFSISSPAFGSNLFDGVNSPFVAEIRGSEPLTFVAGSLGGALDEDSTTAHINSPG